MAAEGVRQIRAAIGADKHIATLALAIEQRQRDVTDAVRVGQPAAFLAADVGDEVLQLAIVELGHGVPRLALQRRATRTLRIVDLNHGGYAVADPREVLFPDGRPHFLDEIPAGAADGDDDQRPVADRSQEIAAAGRVLRAAGVLRPLAAGLGLGLTPVVASDLVLLSFHRAWLPQVGTLSRHDRPLSGIPASVRPAFVRRYAS